MTVMTETPTTYELGPWDLSELVPEPSETVISQRLAQLETAVSAFESRRSDLHPQMKREKFLAILREYEALVEETNVLSNYASLWFYSDTSNKDAITLRNRVRQATTAAGNRTLFFTLWWRGLSDEEAAPLLPQDPAHADDRHYLTDLRRFTPYTLDEKSEQIINVKDDNGIGAVMTLYSMLTNRLEFT